MVSYAGFWKRFCAWFIDQVVLTFAGFFMGFFIGIFVGISAAAEGREISDSDGASMMFLCWFFGFLMTWLYYAIMESSSAQGTLGKMALRIKVVDINGQRIGFGRATGRYFAKILSGLIFMIGYLMAAFTDKKQALHDIVADCLVIDK